jgi:hypothetical protein
VIAGNTSVIKANGSAVSTGINAGAPALNGTMTVAAGATLSIASYTYGSWTNMYMGPSGILNNLGTIYFTPTNVGAWTYIHVYNTSSTAQFNNSGTVIVGPLAGAANGNG